MIDSSTKKPLHVLTAGAAPPYITISVKQLAAVTRMLDDNHVKYWVDEDAISLDGGPELTVINLGRGVDAGAVQRMLDSVP